MLDRTYGRKYFRIKPENPIFADLAIVYIGERQVATGTARVRVTDISPGGLRFLSPLNLPADNRVILELNFKLSDQRFKMQGYIVHKAAMEDDGFQYGFCFKQTDDDLKVCIKKLFNNMLLRMNKHIIILKLNY